MGPSPYLMRVLSQPTKVDDGQWQKFYTEEHVPDVINARVANRGALFRAYNDFALTTKTPSSSGETKLHDARLSHFNELPGDKTFCAVYQTDLEDYTKADELKKVRQTSPVLDGKEYHSLATWDVRVYKLIQNYDPDNLGESAAPFVLHVQNEPANDQDYHKFYEEEHLDLLHKVPGYRRSQRYELINLLQSDLKDVPRFMVIHEFEHLDALDGPELRHADASPNTHRVFGDAKVVNVRGFKSVYSQGYTNSKN